MRGYTGVLPDGEAIHYVDRKRWLWWLSVVYPLQAFVPPWLHHLSGSESWFVLLFALNFVAIPLLDLLIGAVECSGLAGFLLALATEFESCFDEVVFVLRHFCSRRHAESFPRVKHLLGSYG